LPQIRLFSEAIAKIEARERAARIIDTAHGAQGDSKSIQKVIKELESNGRK